MLVDNEKVVALLKRHICSKSSHGQRDLLAELARLEGECMVEEGLPERALRLYGVVFSDDLIRPADREARVPFGDGPDDPSRVAVTATTSEEDIHDGSRHSHAHV